MSVKAGQAQPIESQMKHESQSIRRVWRFNTEPNHAPGPMQGASHAFKGAVHASAHAADSATPRWSLPSQVQRYPRVVAPPGAVRAWRPAMAEIIAEAGCHGLAAAGTGHAGCRGGPQWRSTSFG